MDSREFYNKLMEAQNLMSNQKFEKALTLLKELKQLEKEGDFEYDLIHKLYQLISNATSFYNQQIILEKVNLLTSTKSEPTINLLEFSEYLKNEASLDLDINILKRELELLILRDMASFRIEGDKLIL